MTSIVQELVNRVGWVANNDMRFGLFPQSAAHTDVNVEMLEAAGTAHATLVIDYTAAAAGVPWYKRNVRFSGGLNKMSTGGFDG